MKKLLALLIIGGLLGLTTGCPGPTTGGKKDTGSKTPSSTPKTPSTPSKPSTPTTPPVPPPHTDKGTSDKKDDKKNDKKEDKKEDKKDDKKTGK